jgi:hypothetical protein
MKEKTKERQKLVSTEDNAYVVLPQQPSYIQTLKDLVGPFIESYDFQQTSSLQRTRSS